MYQLVVSFDPILFLGFYFWSIVMLLKKEISSKSGSILPRLRQHQFNCRGYVNLEVRHSYFRVEKVLLLDSLPPAYVVRREGNVLTPVCVSVHRGGTRSSLGRGGDPVSGLGGYPVSGLRGYPGLKSGGYPRSPPSKGKNFDTRFGLIHVQTGKKKFTEGPPPSQ